MRILYAKFAAVIVAIAVVVALAVTAVAVPVSWLGEVGSGDPDDSLLEVSSLSQRSYVYAADGSLLAALHGEENRQPIPIAEVPEHVINAVLSVEDAGFWVHDGVNARGMVRALEANIDAGGVAQGGSTITQQLVKLEFLTTEQTLDRKAQEIVLALRLEREWTKEQILERYLNRVYFGNHSYGIQAAAETYFGVSAAELTVDQAAMLAGMIRNPNIYNPIRFPERVKDRRDVALQRMVDEGFITEDEAAAYGTAPLPTEATQLRQPDTYFVAEVRRLLLQDERLGATYEEREQMLFEGGLKVFTTFDPAAQAQARAARDAHLSLQNGVFPMGTDPETGEPRVATAGIVSVQPDNGAIRTMAGPGFGAYRYNPLIEKPGRNPGSSFKTFVLAAAFEQGMSPEDLIDGKSPCIFDHGAEELYDVQNYTHNSGGIATLRSQTLQSSNCAFVRLGFAIGLDSSIAMADRLGVNPDPAYPLEPVPAASLGTEEVTPLDMASAYATLANDGVYNAPYYIERVEDAEGNVLFQHEPAPQQVVDPQVARLVTSVLLDNVRSGTGTAAAIDGGHPAAGKTGTHQGSTDAWFVGYSRHLATAVWIGGLGGQFPIRISGSNITGGSYPARIWGDYMSAYHAGREVQGFPGPNPRPPTRLIITTPPGIDVTPQPDPPPPPQGGGRPPGQPGWPPFTIPGLPGWPPGRD